MVIIYQQTIYIRLCCLDLRVAGMLPTVRWWKSLTSPIFFLQQSPPGNNPKQITFTLTYVFSLLTERNPLYNEVIYTKHSQ